MAEMLSDVVMWGTVEIPYLCSFSRRKTLSISVHPDLTVTVKAPHNAGLEKIRSFVRKRGRWISRSWQDFEQYLPKQPPKRYISGERHRYLGRQYRLKAEQGTEDSVKCLRGYMQVKTKGEPTSERVKELLDYWYRTHARAVFQERLLICHHKINKDNIPFPVLVIRRMKNDGGVCPSQAE